VRNSKQEISDAIAETQYGVSIIGDQIAQISESRGHYNARLEEKEFLLNEYTKLVEQLESIREEEVNFWEILFRLIAITPIVMKF